jgi:riboflavin biosynthesis pyrimidine reductase
VAKLDAARLGGFITGRRTAIAQDPTLTERQGTALLEIHANFQAENSAQHWLATDKNTEED